MPHAPAAGCFNGHWFAIEYAETLRQAGRSKEAQDFAERTQVDLANHSGPSIARWTRYASLTEARCRVDVGEFAEAEEALLAAWADLEAGSNPKAPLARHCLRSLVLLYEKWQRPLDAAKFRERLPQCRNPLSTKLQVNY